jgi:hypothetical protein
MRQRMGNIPTQIGNPLQDDSGVSRIAVLKSNEKRFR